RRDAGAGAADRSVSLAGARARRVPPRAAARAAAGSGAVRRRRGGRALMDRLAPLRNASALPYAAVPELSLADFHDAIASAIAQELRLCALFVVPRRGATRLLVVV